MKQRAIVGVLSLLFLAGCGDSVESATAKFQKAVDNGDWETVKTIVERVPQLANGKHPLGTPVLLLAAHDHPDVVKVLLDKGADPNVKEGNVGGTPLSNALVRPPNAEIVMMLIAKGANVKDGEGTGESILMRAAKAGNLAIFEAMLAKGADPKAVDPRYGDTLVHYAVSGGNGVIIDKLVALGVDAKQKNTRGISPWVLASKLQESGGSSITALPTDAKDFSTVLQALKKAGAAE